MSEREKLLHEAEWRKCRGTGPTDWEACHYFLTTYAKIRHPERGRIAFELREAQIETLRAWITQRYTITLKARQIGYSTLAACVTLWLIFFHEDKYIIMLSKGEREAQKLWAKGAYTYKFLPDWLKARGPAIRQQTLQKLVFENESNVEVLPSTDDPARGETAYMVFVDEWAKLENPEEAWASIEPVADVGGRIHGLGTAQGSGNFFHRFFWDAWTGVSRRFKGLFYPWSANSDRDETWYEDKVEDNRITPWLVHQEYPRNPEEAFIKSGRSVFDVERLQKMERLTPRRGQLWAPAEDSKFAEFHEHPSGELAMYEPPDPHSVYVLGADVAEGLEHGDFSSAHVLDVATNSVVAHWHGHVEADYYGYILYRLGYFYNTALMGVEAQNHGLTTLVTLHKTLRYPRLYSHRQIGARGSRPTKKLGWQTLINTKGYIIDGLIRSLRGEREVNEHGDIEWVNGMGVYDERTLSELALYVREADGRKMHGSPHDDRVMSLAIANEMVKFAHAPEYQPKEEQAMFTGDWWEQQLHHEPEDDDWVIGSRSVRS